MRSEAAVGPAFDIPQHLLFVLLAALAGNGQVESSRSPQRGEPIVHRQYGFGDEGPFRFAPGAFLDALSGLEGDRRFKRYATRVFKTSSGYAYVPVAAERREILALRGDPVVTRHVAESYARANRVRLERSLGRPPSLCELYLAHRLGAGMAIEFTSRLAAAPRAKAVIALPEIDDAAPDLVFAGERARTLGEIASAADRALARAAEDAGVNAVVSPRAEPAALPGSSGRRVAAPRHSRIMGWRVGIERAAR